MVAEAMSVRVATHSGDKVTDIATFEQDMPRQIPLQRWDSNDLLLAKHSTRFSGFIEGAKHVQGARTNLPGYNSFLRRI